MLEVISQTEILHPFLSSRAGIWYLCDLDPYFSWNLKRKLVCVSVKKRFNVFIFLWCLLPLWVSITITNNALECTFVMWNPHIEFFVGLLCVCVCETTFLKLLKSCQSWKAAFIELILNNSNSKVVQIEESWEVGALSEFSHLIS